MHEILINIIGAAVTLVVIPLLGFAGKALIAHIQEKTKSERLKRCLTTAADVIEKAVAAVKMDGEAASAKASALISGEIKAVIAEAHIDFEKWLQNQIEAHISGGGK